MAGASVQAMAPDRTAPDSRALHGDGEILVLGQRVGGIAAQLLQRRRRQAPTAPGTTVSVSSADSARRSRFCAMIYSSACQRVTMLTRLPTLALPATAPILGSANQRASRPDGVGVELGVGIERHHDGAVGVRQPDVQGIGLAAVGERDQADARLAPNSPRTTSAVLSVEPSSSTSTSRSG